MLCACMHLHASFTNCKLSDCHAPSPASQCRAWSAIDTAAAGHSTHDPPPEKYGSAPSALRTCPPGARTLRPPCGCGGTAGAAPWPGSSPIRGVGGLCTDATGAAAPHWLRPTIIAIWPARAGEAAGRSAQQCFPCCLLDPPIPGSAVDRSLYIRSGLPWEKATVPYARS